jgi:uncharacterized protein with HEPN domain
MKDKPNYYQAIKNFKSNKSKAIISLRNQVIHAYDTISDENIWSILTNHPKLKKEIEHLIGEK